jgi:Lon protease-like protein
MAVMPMFPLGSTVLPGDVLPLHVFEPRYLQLVKDCIEEPEHEFGVAFIERGHEVGGGDERRGVGTVVRMVQVAEIGDGRFAVMSVGTHRIRVLQWLPDDPYPVADVEHWPDEEPDHPDLGALLGELLPRVRRAAALALELGDPVGDPQQDLGGDPLVASYQLCSLAPVGAADRYDLLCAAGPMARLQLLASRLDDLETLLQLRLGSA